MVGGAAAAAHLETQAEFVDALQMTESEQEAHQLLKRRLERAIPGSEVVVLNRNNSADRLEPTTDVTEGSPFAESLAEAKPRSCLAVRYARPHRGDRERDPLIQCQVCGKTVGRTTTCEPLLVGGEVIGSVLIEHPRSSDNDEAARSGNPSARPLPCWRTCATSPSPRCGRPPTHSPVSPTTGRSATRSSAWSPRRPAAVAALGGRCSTWTTSSRSTTPTVTTAATTSSPQSGRRSNRPSARATSSGATAARSSSSSFRRPAPSRVCSWPRRCGPPSRRSGSRAWIGGSRRAWASPRSPSTPATATASYERLTGPCTQPRPPAGTAPRLPTTAPTCRYRGVAVSQVDPSRRGLSRAGAERPRARPRGAWRPRRQRTRTSR